MKNKILVFSALVHTSSLLAQSAYDPNPELDREQNPGCMSSRCIVNLVLDNRNLPEIRVAPSYSTRIKFPREVVRCEDDTNTIRITSADDEGEDRGKAAQAKKKPFWEARVKVVVDQSGGGGSIFSMPPVNVLCDFENGDTITFYAKISPDPHHIVRFVDREAEQSGLEWLFSTGSKGGVVPLGPAPSLPKSSPGVVRFDSGKGPAQKSEREALESLFARGGKEE